MKGFEDFPMLCTSRRNGEGPICDSRLGCKCMAGRSDVEFAAARMFGFLRKSEISQQHVTFGTCRLRIVAGIELY